MASNWEKVEPFFHRSGLFSYRPEKYGEHADKVFDLCQELNIKMVDYLTGVFFPRFSEGLSEFRIRPHHLHSKWALQKFSDYQISRKGNLSAYSMERIFIRRTKEYIASLKMDEQEYLVGGGLIPPVFDDLRRRKVSIVYCSCQKSFRDMFALLPPDIKDEYFSGIDVYYIYKQTRINSKLMEVINE